MTDIQKSFLDWWHSEGSALRPLGNEDLEEFARRVTEIAWLSGAFVQKYGLEKMNTVTFEELLIFETVSDQKTKECYELIRHLKDESK